MWMFCVQLPRSVPHTAQNAAHRFCEKPVFFTFLRIRTHPSSCFDSTIPRTACGRVVLFFQQVPSLQPSLASGERCQVVARGRPNPRRRAAPGDEECRSPKTQPSLTPATSHKNKDATNTQDPGRPADGCAVAVARQRALRRARGRAQGRRAPVLREQGRGEAREPSRARSHILEADDRRVVGDRPTAERFIKERRVLAPARRRR